MSIDDAFIKQYFDLVFKANFVWHSIKNTANNSYHSNKTEHILEYAIRSIYLNNQLYKYYYWYNRERQVTYRAKKYKIYNLAREADDILFGNITVKDFAIGMPLGHIYCPVHRRLLRVLKFIHNLVVSLGGEFIFLVGPIFYDAPYNRYMYSHFNATGCDFDVKGISRRKLFVKLSKLNHIFAKANVTYIIGEYFHLEISNYESKMIRPNAFIKYLCCADKYKDKEHRFPLPVFMKNTNLNIPNLKMINTISPDKLEC